LLISGIVTVDPPFNQSLISNPPPPRPDRDTLFTDEEKRKQLDKLLKSNKPEDLQVIFAYCLYTSNQAYKKDTHY